MHPSQWVDPGVQINLTRKEELEHAVSCFHFLLKWPGHKVQRYTTGELADAICAAYDVKNGDPRTAWTVKLLRSFDATVLVRNFWGV